MGVRLLCIVDPCRDAYRFSEHDQAALPLSMLLSEAFISVWIAVCIFSIPLDCTQIYFCI
jgi:hypothetical protein